MSQENVETVRRSFQAFNDRNVDAMLADWTEEPYSNRVIES
jgi:hypothetical protein